MALLPPPQAAASVTSAATISLSDVRRRRVTIVPERANGRDIAMLEERRGFERSCVFGDHVPCPFTGHGIELGGALLERIPVHVSQGSDMEMTSRSLTLGAPLVVS